MRLLFKGKRKICSAGVEKA